MKSPRPILQESSESANQDLEREHSSISTASPWLILDALSSDNTPSSIVRSYNSSSDPAASGSSLRETPSSSERSAAHGLIPTSVEINENSQHRINEGSSEEQRDGTAQDLDPFADFIFPLSDTSENVWADIPQTWPTSDPTLALANEDAAFLGLNQQATGFDHAAEVALQNDRISHPPATLSLTPSSRDSQPRGKKRSASSLESSRSPSTGGQPRGFLSYEHDPNDLFDADGFQWIADNEVEVRDCFANVDNLFSKNDRDSQDAVASTTQQRTLEPPIEYTKRNKMKKKRLDPDQKQKVKRVRRLGACLRCRIYREQCDESTPCGSCTRRATSATIFKQPCYREPLDNVVAFRLGNSTQGQTRAVYPKLNWSAEDADMRKIQLIYAHAPEGTSPILELGCRRFLPGPKDVTNLVWMSDGTKKELIIPPYAVFDIDVAYEAMGRFLDQCQDALHDAVIKSTSDELRLLTLAEAKRFADLHSATKIQNALKIRDFAVKRVALNDVETLGIGVINDKQSRHHNTRPIPRFVNIQVEIMINNIIDTHRKTVIRRLKSLIFGSKAKISWFEIYLSIFLLLDTLEFAYQWQLKYVGWAKGTSLYNYIDYVTNYMLDEWQYSAEVLVAHFRCVLRGQTPFSQDSDESAENFALMNLDAESIVYLEKVKAIVGSRKLDFDKLKEIGSFKLDRPFVWLSQLFMSDKSSSTPG